MPELPEVEVTRLGLLSHLPGRKVVAVSWSDKRLRRPMPRQLLSRWIKGDRIAAVDRRAKYLLVRTTSGGVMVVHLGMSGRLGLFAAETKLSAHDHLRLSLDNGMELRFNDSRRFGLIMVWPPAEAAALQARFFARTGPEPLGAGFHRRWLLQQARRRTQPVKNFLMDQRVVAGIGNIYASEILFAAGIHPRTRVNDLDGPDWQRIIDCCREILTAAIGMGGTTIADFLGSSGRPGYFQLRLQVYKRAGEPCRRCGSTITKTVLAGRTTYCCPACQKKS